PSWTLLSLKNNFAREILSVPNDLFLLSSCRFFVGRSLAVTLFFCWTIFMSRLVPPISALLWLSILPSLLLYLAALQVYSPYPPCLLSHPDSSLIPHPSIQFTSIDSIHPIDSIAS